MLENILSDTHEKVKQEQKQKHVYSNMAFQQHSNPNSLQWWVYLEQVFI